MLTSKSLFDPRESCLALLSLLVVCSSTAFGQVLPTSVGRQLAPDAMVVIPPSMEYGETFQGPVDLRSVKANPELEWTPNEAPKSETLYERAQGIIFRVPIYCLEFAFKPVRTIEVNVPTEQGVEKQLVWYMVYRVRYLGNDHQPSLLEDAPQGDIIGKQVYGTPNSVAANWVRFMPVFTLETKGKVPQRITDQVIPAAVAAIESRERIGRPLFDSISIQQQKIAISGDGADQSVWGVATWTDVYPRTNFFSVEVKGLTNAQQIIQDGQDFRYPQKTLVLNFFRPGDGRIDSENEIRYGVPAVSRVDGLKEELRKSIANRDYELTITGGLTPEMNLPQVMREVAQTLSDQGAEQIRSYTSSGILVFSFQEADQESKLEQSVLRQVGVQVKILNRTIPLSEAIRRTEQAKDEEAQAYVLEQFGLQERLDHHWVFR